MIGEASTGEQATLLAKNLEPDLIIMDNIMLGIGGIEATRRILRYNSNIKILALTGYTDEPYLSDLIREGILGYLPKNSGPDELIHAIMTVYSGQRYLSIHIAKNRLQKILHH